MGLASAIALGAGVAMVSVTAGAAPTLLFTGSISAASGTAAYTGGAPWSDGVLEYKVSYESFAPGQPIHWTYDYIFKDGGSGNNIRNVSHMIVEASSNFTSANILDGTTFKGTSKLEGPKGNWGNGSPNLPSTIFGLKFDADTGVTSGGLRTTKYTLVTDRAPVYGDIYLKSGKNSGQDITFRNAGFGNPESDPTGGPSAAQWSIILSGVVPSGFGSMQAYFASLFSGSIANHVLVPDSVVVSQVPVPAALPIMAAALAGFGFAGWRRHRHAA